MNSDNHLHHDAHYLSLEKRAFIISLHKKGRTFRAVADSFYEQFQRKTYKQTRVIKIINTKQIFSIKIMHILTVYLLKLGEI